MSARRRHESEHLEREKVFDMEVSMLFALGMDAIILVSDNILHRIVIVV